MGKDTFVNSAGTDPFEARVGAVVGGKWTLERLIGVGGMAAVYEARHEIGRREALKILHPEIARQDELRRRFEQEAYAVNKLDHRGVVEIRDIGTTEDGCPYLVMELLSGNTLADRLLEQTLAAEDALRHIDELLAVLEAAHGAGIVHRDLKPENLFITSDQTLKVLDFGIARVRASDAMKVVTQTGTALGTPNYMPPEQIKGVDIDHRADLFAVGAILFELLTGKDVHPASSQQELIVKMLTTPAPPLGTVASHIPEPICQVVDRALAFDADGRYPDAATMRRDLAEARAGRPPPFAVATPTSIHDRATIAKDGIAAGAAFGMSSSPPASSTPQSQLPHSHAAVRMTPDASLAIGGGAPMSGASDVAAASGGAVAAVTHLPGSHAAVPTIPDHDEEEDDGKRLIVAVIVLGTLIGALATILIIRASSDDAEETTGAAEARSDDDDGGGRRRSPKRKNAPAPSPSGNAPAVAPTAEPGGLDPPPPDPTKPDPNNVAPQPAPSQPAGPEPTAPPPIDPQPPEPPPPPPPPSPTTKPEPEGPPPGKGPPPHARKKKKERKRKKKKKKKKKKRRDDDD